MSNYNKIKEMNLEALTEFLSGICENTAIKLNGVYVVNDISFIRQWLLQEVDEDDTKRKES